MVSSRTLLLAKFLSAAAAATAASLAYTADVSTLATMAVEAPLELVAAQFEQQSGHDVTIQVDTSPNITRRLAAGESADVLIALAATVDQAIAAGTALADSRAAIGKMGVGVAVSRGAAKPDISSPAALAAALRSASAVLYSQGASGVYVEQMLRTLNLLEPLRAKITQLPSGGHVMQRLAEGRPNEIGFTMVSEIKQGEALGGSLVGPLPAALQSYTAYDAIVMSSARSPDAARAFIRALATPAARSSLAATGWQF